YLFHPAVPRRLHDLLPDAKLVVLLRDPVRRAYSHYWHERAKGREKLEFEDAIAAEPERIASADAKLADGSLDRSADHQHFSYLARGRYAEQLERWLALYPRDRFRVVRFEDLVEDPLARLNETLAFLGLPAATKVDLEPRNTRRYPAMKAATAERLREHFAPHNRRLEQLLGVPFGW
ncbi:MAG: sulfotransferase domain-containing protein, partial [Gammaproteobacteria bacterium]|nr:sulfotransferase domain-containing protein [Gammaproteobacteria bacterium]